MYALTEVGTWRQAVSHTQSHSVTLSHTLSHPVTPTPDRRWTETVVTARHKVYRTNVFIAKSSFLLKLTYTPTAALDRFKPSPDWGRGREGRVRLAVTPLTDVFERKQGTSLARDRLA